MQRTANRETIYMATTVHPGAPAAPSTPAAPLTDQARLVLATIGAALLVGVAGDVLAREVQPGAGWAIFLTVFLVALGALARLRGGLTPAQQAMLVPVVFLAESFAWRDAGGLFAFNLLALLVSLAVLSLSLASGGAWSVATAGFAGMARACFHAAVNAVIGAPALVVADADLRGAAGGRGARLGAVARGLVLTLPLLIVFGALLMSADPLFSRLVTGLVAVDLDVVVSHVLVVGALAWLAGGYLRGALVAQPTQAAVAVPRFAVGAVEAGMVLGALDLLFASFLVLQARYLFGGAEHVLTTAGLTLAEYARGGFYELMWVAALALPVLLVGHALVRDDPRALRLYRRLGAVLAALVGVMLVSAAARMRLYVGEFGLTEDRIYASAMMLWLGAVFAAFYVTVLRGRPERLAGAALVSAWAMMGALNVANPPALIARVNIARFEAGHDIDGAYLGRLGAGAVPHALAVLPTLDASQGCLLANGLLQRWADRPGEGWRGWNKARAEARALVAARRAELERAGWGKPGERHGCVGAHTTAAAARVEAAAGSAAATTGTPAARPWWEAGAGPSPNVRVEVPSLAAAPAATPGADQAAVQAAVDEWFAAMSFSAGETPDWARVERVMAPGATIAPPRLELYADGAVHGMFRVPLERSVRIAGDLAQATVRYALRRAADGPVVANGFALLTLRRDDRGAWRLTSAAWEQSADDRTEPVP